MKNRREKSLCAVWKNPLSKSLQMLALMAQLCLTKSRNADSLGYGFDAYTETYGNMIELVLLTQQK